jgi:regulation of enolase protein 1 (concanavalin A-like superfamily)
MDLNNFEWTRMPGDYEICDGKVRITTKPHTDLCHRTYYHFRNDNAPVLQMETDKK